MASKMKRPAEQRSPPERIGPYEVLLKIASGGMATVYLARAQGIGGFEREVALKLMHAHLQESAEFADDLVEEAKLAVRIRNTHVASVLDVGEDPLGIYLVMDYVEGDTLAGLQRLASAAGGKLPLRIGMRILVDALSGLHAAHEVKDAAGQYIGVVHRDFSPQNILVGLDGVARLTDFGIAKATTRLSSTTTGVIKGKIIYMSPEQARGQSVDRRCDVWAAGILAWQIATGRKLYETDNDLAVLAKIATTEPPRVRSVDPAVSEALDAAIAGALTLDIERRCPTAAAFRQAIVAACRVSGDIAEHEDVANYMASVAGKRLAERRARISELLELRVRMGRLADNSGDRSQPTPSAVRAIAEPHEVAPSQPPTVADQTVMELEAVTEYLGSPVARDGDKAAETALTRTETISVTTSDSGGVRMPAEWRARAPWIGAAALGALVLVGLAGVLGVLTLTRSTVAAHDALAVATPSATASQAPQPSASAHLADATPALDTGRADEAVPVLAARSAAPSARPPLKKPVTAPAAKADAGAHAGKTLYGRD